MAFFVPVVFGISECYKKKHLMTGPMGNSEYCFSRISMFPETIEILGKQNSLFPSGLVIKC